MLTNILSFKVSVNSNTFQMFGLPAVFNVLKTCLIQAAPLIVLIYAFCLCLSEIAALGPSL